MKILFKSLLGCALLVSGFFIWYVSQLGQADRCDLFSRDSSYTVESWNYVEFHLPSCWEYKETEDGNLIIYNRFDTENLKAYASLWFYLDLDLSDYSKARTVDVNGREFEEYVQSTYDPIYVPTEFQNPLYIVAIENDYDSYPEFEIVFGSIVEKFNEVEVQTGEQSPPIISIETPSDGAVFDPSMTPIIFEGTVNGEVERIVVTADYTYVDIENDTSTARQDVYELSDFQPGDTSFVYRASTDWNNLGLGENHYTFTAYRADSSKESVELNIHYQFEAF